MHKTLPSLGNEKEQQQIKYYKKSPGKLIFLWESKNLKIFYFIRLTGWMLKNLYHWTADASNWLILIVKSKLKWFGLGLHIMETLSLNGNWKFSQLIRITAYQQLYTAFLKYHSSQLSAILQYLQYQASQLFTQSSLLFQRRQKAREYELLTSMLNSKLDHRKEYFCSAY